MPAKGDKIICSIWSGPMPGIYIGFVNRDEYFSPDINRIILVIDERECIVDLPPSFWKSCPEIRVARDRFGRNYLSYWIRKNNLLPPGLSRQVKGKEDRVVLEVIEPFRKFRLKKYE